MIEMEEKVRIPDNFILRYRQLPVNHREEEKTDEENKPKDCFGHYSSCTNPAECPIRMRCLKEKIEHIRRGILGERLSLKFKRGLLELASSPIPQSSVRDIMRRSSAFSSTEK
jgi:hypothetical protein